MVVFHDKPPNGGVDSFIGCVGLIIALASFIASLLSGAFDSPYFNVVVVVAAIAGSFLFGYYARDAREYLSSRSARRLDAAAAGAVEARMADVERIVDERVARLEAGLDGRMAEAARRHDEESRVLHEGDVRLADDEEVRERLRNAGGK